MPSLSTNPPPPPTVSIRTLLTTDSKALFNTDTNAADYSAVWADYMLKNRYVDRPYRYMMANSMPGHLLDTQQLAEGTCSFVQLAQPTLLWVCEWTVCRWKKRPLIPRPETGDTSWVLLLKLPETASVTTGSDGTSPLYRVSGVYVYGHRNPGEVLNHMRFGRPPWMIDAVNRRLDMSMYAADLSDGNGQPNPENDP